MKKLKEKDSFTRVLSIPYRKAIIASSHQLERIETLWKDHLKRTKNAFS